MNVILAELAPLGRHAHSLLKKLDGLKCYEKKLSDVQISALWESSAEALPTP